MWDMETISIKPKRHVVSTEPFPEGDDVEVVSFEGERIFGGEGQY